MKADEIEVYDEVLKYISNIGLRCENNRSNQKVYTELMKFIFKSMEEKEETNKLMYFLDCVAHNILYVQIFRIPLGKYTIKLDDKRYSRKFMDKYEALVTIKRTLQSN